MVGIYKVTNPKGRVYVGQSINILHRFRTYTQLKCKGQVRLFNSFLKYGVINHSFDIVEECLEVNLNIQERYWQDFYDVLGKKGLNCKLTKTSDRSGQLSEETKSKISNTNRGKKSWVKGKTQSGTHVSKRSEALKGRPTRRKGYSHSLETKQKISKANKGKVVSQETRIKISDSKKGIESKLKGIPRSLQTRKKISEAQLGKSRKPLSEETKEKISNASRKVQGNVKGYDKRGTLLFQFENIRDVRNEGFTLTGVFRCIQGYTKSHRNIIWK